MIFILFKLKLFRFRDKKKMFKSQRNSRLEPRKTEASLRFHYETEPIIFKKTKKNKHK